MKLEVGMYVRTNKVGIKKIYKIDNNKTKYKYLYKLKNQDGDGCIDLGVLCEDDIVKFSYNIIDILEKGDYVNGVEITEIYEKGDSFRGNRNYIFKEKIIEVANDNYETIPVEALFTNNGIETIVTKEQFENMEYRIGE